MTDQALIILNGWDLPVVGSMLLERQRELKAALELSNHAVTTQEQADEVAALIGEARRFECDIEEASKEARAPFFEHGKRIKSVTDAVQLVVITARMKVERQLAEWEAEKLRVKQNLERQAREEADRLKREEQQRQREAELKRQAEERAERERLAAIERERLAAANKKERERLERLAAEERQRQEEAALKRQQEAEAERIRLASIVPVEVTYEAPKTEGVQSGVQWEHEVTNERDFAEWCWNNSRDEWVRSVEFNKRPITEWLSKLPTDGAAPQIPGLTIRKVAAVRVEKAKKRKDITLPATTRIEM